MAVDVCKLFKHQCKSRTLEEVVRHQCHGKSLLKPLLGSVLGNEERSRIVCIVISRNLGSRGTYCFESRPKHLPDWCD